MEDEQKLKELREKIKQFCGEREWDQFHNAKDLVVGLVVEAGELLEHFQWKNKEQVEEMFSNPKKREDMEDEMADVLYYLIRLSQKYNIDLNKALERKIDKNIEKYPVEKAKGSIKKYNEF